MALNNKINRTIAVGDIHGCAAELEALIERLRPTGQDRFVFLGDYVDRGPESKRVIDLIIDLSEQCEVIALKGNHEAMFLDFLEHPESPGAGLFILNGGSATLASYGNSTGGFDIPESHLKFLKDLRLWYETEKYFFVHAGVPLQPLATLNEKENEDTVLWSRQPFLSTTYKWEKLIIHGHTPAPDPEKKPNRINIDTGCVYGGYLTAVELPSGKFHQVPRGAEVAPPLYPLDPQRPREVGKSRIALRFNGRLPVIAGRVGEELQNFETLNYNQFGLLLTEKQAHKKPSFGANDHIHGYIGQGENAIRFEGVVVRIETRSEFINYGVRIDRISDGDNGQEWMSRPK